MLLPAAPEGAFEQMLRIGECPGHISTLNAPSRTDELLFRNGFINGEDGGKRFDLEANGRLGGPDRLSGCARQHDDWLPNVVANVRGQQFFVMENRAERVLTGDVRMRVDRDDSVYSSGLADVDLLDSSMR